MFNFIFSSYYINVINISLQFIFLYVFTAEYFGQYAYIIAICELFFLGITFVSSKGMLYFSRDSEKLDASIYLFIVMSAFVLFLALAIAPFIVSVSFIIYFLLSIFFKILINFSSITLSKQEAVLEYKLIATYQAISHTLGALATVIFLIYSPSLITLFIKEFVVSAFMFCFSLKFARFNFRFQWNSIIEVIKFGTNITLFRSVNSISVQLPIIFLKAISSNDLVGYYNRTMWLIGMFDRFIGPLVQRIGYSFYTNKNITKCDLRQVFLSNLSVVWIGGCLLWSFAYTEQINFVIAQVGLDHWAPVSDLFKQVAPLCVLTPLFGSIIQQFLIAKNQFARLILIHSFRLSLLLIVYYIFVDESPYLLFNGVIFGFVSLLVLSLSFRDIRKYSISFLSKRDFFIGILLAALNVIASRAFGPELSILVFCGSIIFYLIMCRSIVENLELLKKEIRNEK